MWRAALLAALALAGCAQPPVDSLPADSPRAVCGDEPAPESETSPDLVRLYVNNELEGARRCVRAWMDGTLVFARELPYDAHGAGAPANQGAFVWTEDAATLRVDDGARQHEERLDLRDGRHVVVMLFGSRIEVSQHRDEPAFM